VRPKPHSFHAINSHKCIWRQNSPNKTGQDPPKPNGNQPLTSSGVHNLRGKVDDGERTEANFNKKLKSPRNRRTARLQNLNLKAKRMGNQKPTSIWVLDLLDKLRTTSGLQHPAIKIGEEEERDCKSRDSLEKRTRIQNFKPKSEAERLERLEGAVKLIHGSAPNSTSPTRRRRMAWSRWSSTGSAWERSRSGC